LVRRRERKERGEEKSPPEPNYYAAMYTLDYWEDHTRTLLTPP
jgi:hypothetical protein